MKKKVLSIKKKLGNEISKVRMKLSKIWWEPKWSKDLHSNKKKQEIIFSFKLESNFKRVLSLLQPKHVSADNCKCIMFI